MADIDNIFDSLNKLLGNTDLTDVTAESNNFPQLKDGYYLCEVATAELKINKNNDPMVAFKFVVAEDGKEINEDGIVVDIPKTAKRSIFINYVLKDDTTVKRFVTDMLKFEGDEPGVPILEKEYFMNSEVLEDALDILIGKCIYISVNTSEKKDGTKSTWSNPVSWKRVEALGLEE